MNSFTFTKTILDYLISILCLIVLSPFLISYSIYLILVNGTSPIIVQERSLGLTNGKLKIYKFRTMKEGAEVYYNSIDSLRKISTIYPYLPLGKFLRSTGLDEVPQLLNVLSGKMSIIGPRPLLFEDLERVGTYNEKYLKIRDNLKCKPGISGFWQLERGNKLKFKELVEQDKEYENNKCLKNEISLLFKTLLKLAKRDHSETIH